MELSDRKLRILQAIIDDYVSTSIPVGSRTLSKKPDLHYSSATIRNEMADLEEMGYLDKPHTSAGRMPSDTAYRLYVDRMMRVGQLDKADVDFIRTYFDKRVNELSEVLDATAKVISETTKQIALVSVPQLTGVSLRRIQLVKITDTKAMLIIVTDSGLVEDTVITVPVMMDGSQMEQLSNRLTAIALDVPIEQVSERIRSVAEGMAHEYRQVMSEVFESIDNSRAKKAMVLDGAQNIFKFPEYKDIGKAQHFLELLDTKDRLYALLGKTQDFEFSIKIGSENNSADLKDMSVVTATYRVGDKKLGSFGVIGPTRMDYARVLSVLNYVGMSLNEILSCFLEADHTSPRER